MSLPKDRDPNKPIARPGTGTTASAARTIDSPEFLDLLRHMQRDLARAEPDGCATLNMVKHINQWGAALAEEARREADEAHHRALVKTEMEARNAGYREGYAASTEAVERMLAQRTAGGDAVAELMGIAEACAAQRCTAPMEDYLDSKGEPVAEAAAQADDWHAAIEAAAKQAIKYTRIPRDLLGQPSAELKAMAAKGEAIAASIRALPRHAATAQPTPIKNPADAKSAEGGTVWGGSVSQPTPPDDERARMIESMCLTWRHDFGLDRRPGDAISSGMSEGQRDSLRRQMGQLYDHHFAPALAALRQPGALPDEAEKFAAAIVDAEWSDEGCCPFCQAFGAATNHTHSEDCIVHAAKQAATGDRK